MTITKKETSLSEQQYVLKSAPELPKKQWLTPLPFLVREVDETGKERGRWLRVYQSLEGDAVVLRKAPKRNTQVTLPTNLIPVAR